jgi:hypothetical protein
MFSKVSEFAYFMQEYFSNDILSPFEGQILIAGRAYEFTVYAGLSELVIGFIAVILISLAITISTTIFIARHEPMKTMTRY